MFILLLIPLISCFFKRAEKTSKCNIGIGDDKCSIICDVAQKSKCSIVGKDTKDPFAYCTCLDTAASLDIKEKDTCQKDLEDLKKKYDKCEKDVIEMKKAYGATEKKLNDEISKLGQEIKELKNPKEIPKEKTKEILKEKMKEIQKEIPKEKPKEKTKEIPKEKPKEK